VTGPSSPPASAAAGEALCMRSRPRWGPPGVQHSWAGAQPDGERSQNSSQCPGIDHAARGTLDLGNDQEPVPPVARTR
jgi:hypothetical protein